jgi:hypothetical protein
LAAATDSYALTGLENYTLYMVTLKAMVGDTAVYTDTLTAMPTDLFIYLPLIQKGN